MKASTIASQKKTRPFKARARLLAAFAVPAILLLSATLLRASDTVVEMADDAAISTGVKTALLHHLTFNFLVRTQNGVVTLSGSAADTAEKDGNSKIAAGITGVKRVINDMIVSAVVATNH